jgi:P4 family phage/plasmid primase-like protien
MDTINALGAMLTIDQWFIWRLTWDQEETKFQKVPCFPDGRRFRMDASNRDNWMNIAQARVALTRLRALNDGHAYTLGFWLTADTGYWFFDIDKCASEGKLSPLAQQLAAGFNGAAWEWSSSGTGLHIFGRGNVPEHRRKDAFKQNLEFYTDKRGIAFGLSGQFFGNADLDFTPQVQWLCANYFPPQALPGEVLDSEFDTPHASWNGPADDDELIARMRRSERLDAAAVFTGTPSQHATFSDLFDNRADVLARCYAGASDMDYALIGFLSFWTGRDAIRTERIMRRSSLARDKWDTQRGKENYLRYSILRQFRQSHAEARPVYGAQRTAQPVASVAGSGSGTVAQDGGGNNQTVTAAGNIAGSGRLGVGAGGVPIAAAGQGSIGALAPDAGQLSGPVSAAGTVTITQVDPSRKQCLQRHRSAFQSAADSEELEQAALAAKADPALTDDLAESLAHDLLRRYDEIQVRKRIGWCRALLLPERAGLPAGQHRDCTEFGNVHRMMDKFGNELMFASETEQWYRWHENRWLAATPEEVTFMASETIRSIMDEARDEQNEEERARLMQWARDSQKANMVRNMTMLARAQPRVFVRTGVLDADTRFMGAANGIIDLQTGQLLPAAREARITQYAGCDYLPGADAPWFKQTVREAFFDDLEMVIFFKRLMGYTLLGNPVEQRLIIPYGHGANGKSTIMGAIGKALGNYAAAAAAETFTTTEGSRGSSAGGPREDLVRLRAARLLTISEVDENAHLKEATVKSLTGDDPITARGVQAKASVTYRPRFVPVMSVNHRPIIKGDDAGIWRRIMLVPFERNFKEDPNLPEDRHRSARISQELPGVLRWLVEGALEYQQHGLNAPVAVLAATEDYRSDMDLLKEWIDTRIVLDPDGAISTADMFVSWQQYAMPKGLLRLIGTSNALTRKLTGRKGFVKGQHCNGVRGRCWVGMRLKTIAEITFNA